MNLLTIEKFSKAYTDRNLFMEAAFSIQEGEKIGVIGMNGMGKSTLLKIIAGIEETDEGQVIMGNHVKVGYLPQTPVFLPGLNVLEAALQGMDAADMGLVSDAKAMLNQLAMDDYEQKIDQLSGGQKKRIALVHTLLNQVEILVLDEPTNHLDNEMSRWLEDYLIGYRGAVVMVTHDRYFLDRIVTRIIEVENGKIYSYPGTYSEYVALRLQRQSMEQATEQKRQSIMRKELAWLARGARARATKQKAHIQRIEALQNQAAPQEEMQVALSSVSSRMGRKTIELANLFKSFGDLNLITDFSYIFLRDDRIGIVGANGCGKSTLLKMIIGELMPDSGTIETGDTIKIGYFAQDNVHMNTDMKAIDYVREVAEYIQTTDGKITASALMERFLFDGTMQWSKIGKLSGGERRRLYLLRILMRSPNVLIFDEPTNDLDIQTLSILEDYLDAFDGIVITVSHDRYFLDRVVKRIFAFEGNGQIQQYEGCYVDYLRARAQRYPEKYTEDGGSQQNAFSKKQEEAAGRKKEKPSLIPPKLKFTFKEQREFETIDEDITTLEDKVADLEQQMLANATNSMRLGELLKEKEEAEQQLEDKIKRWVYLNDFAEKIEAQKQK